MAEWTSISLEEKKNKYEVINFLQKHKRWKNTKIFTIHHTDSKFLTCSIQSTEPQNCSYQVSDISISLVLILQKLSNTEY